MYQERMRVASAEFADRCIDTVQSAADALDYDSLQVFSGAGHDASYLSTVCDTGMVFAVSEAGKSHSKEEYTSWENCCAATNTLANAALTLAMADDG